MEQLLHYVWKHRIFPLQPLHTTDGARVEVLDPGLHNRNAGPDFFNAKLRIDNIVWVGNVEIHLRSSDWYAHGHDRNGQYDNVVLHVASDIDAEVRTSQGKVVPQLLLQVPPPIEANFRQLLAFDNYPPCYKLIPQLSSLKIEHWLSVLQTERLERKTDDILRRLALCNGSWEQVCFVTLARNYGFGINGDAFETWAYNLPLQAAAHHRDDLFQLEALFLGQAGLLELEAVPAYHQQEALADGYLARLRKEYQFLAHKFHLTPMDRSLWRFLRLRPQNFPHIRLVQLAHLYYHRKANLSQLMACTTVLELHEALATSATPYWQTHYSFGAVCARNEKHLSPFSLNLIIINTVIPMLFAYGRHQAKDELCQRAFALLSTLRPENNHIVRMWKDCGLQVENAGHSQALLQLKLQYCDRKDCLRCHFGREYVKTM